MMTTVDFDTIKNKIDILALVGLQGVKPTATTNGGEWKTACPVCGGKDRFSVWANHPKGARGWCRQCNRSFDALDIYAIVNNLTVTEAIHELQRKTTINLNSDNCRSSEKISQATDREQWYIKYLEMVSQWHDAIFKAENKKALDWLENRGIGVPGVIANQLGFNENDLYMDPDDWGLWSRDKVFIPRGITIPNEGHGINVRRSTSDHKQKYMKVSGSEGYLFVAGLKFKHAIGFLFESELDAILASQSGFSAAYFSLPAGQYLKPEFQHYLNYVEDLIICMDSDKAGRAAAKKHLEIKGTIEGDYLPGVKDLGELFQKSGMDAITNYLLDQADRIEGKQWQSIQQ